MHGYEVKIVTFGMLYPISAVSLVVQWNTLRGTVLEMR